MSSITQHGYLVLADISGYTSYLSGVELDHAHEILSDLLETVLVRLTPPLTFAKLEGDAIFAYAPETVLSRGETLLELLEAAYLAFRDRQASMHHRTTCTCNACRNIDALDLKFFAHHGDYIVQSVATVKELVGSDVNLVHRLTKNHVSESAGWRAYALFTRAGLEHLNIGVAGLLEHTESYEHLGDVQTFSLNLHPRYQELCGARRVVVEPDAAHEIIDLEFRSPLYAVWDWFNDPRKRSQWMQAELRPVARVGGRAVAGARNHCAHGQNEIIVEDLLDIRPFEYYTIAHTPQGADSTVTMTYRFTPVEGGGARVRITFRGRIGRLPDFIGRLLVKYVVKNIIKGHWAFERIDDFIAQGAEGLKAA